MVKKWRILLQILNLSFQVSSCVKTKRISRKKLVRRIKDWKTIVNKKNFDFVDSSNIIEEHLGSKKFKKLHLNTRVNSVLANNVLKYLRDSYWNDDVLNCGMKYDECKCKLPAKSVNSIYVRSIRDVRKRNFKRIILGHLKVH